MTDDSPVFLITRRTGMLNEQTDTIDAVRESRANEIADYMSKWGYNSW